MLIVFRVDSSTAIGTGHLMRCLALADALRAKGATCIFICRAHKKNVNSLVHQKNFRLHELPAGNEPLSADDLGVEMSLDAEETKTIINNLGIRPDWLIVDHYGIDHNWEKQLRHFVKKIFVIDDLANRYHDCDVLLDQNYSNNPSRYQNLVSKDCYLLLGTEYTILRPQFLRARQKIEQEGRPPFDPRKVFIFFGGVDRQNYTGKALNILLEIGNFAPEVVIGSQNPHHETLQQQMQKFPDGQLHIQIDNIAEVMMRCSWYLGAGGSITWERMCLGLTGIVVPVANNQLEFSHLLDRDGFHKVVDDLCIEKIAQTYKSYILSNDLKESIARSYLCLDGRSTDRVIKQLLQSKATV